MKRKTNASFAKSEFRTDRQLVNQQHQFALFEGRAGCWIRSSYKGRTVNALALEADEGRGYLRKDPGSW